MDRATTPCLRKIGQFYFLKKNFDKSGPVFETFRCQFRKDLRRKPKLKLSHPLKSVAALPCEM